MRAIRVIADIQVADIASARDFYADYLGLSTEEFNMGRVARYTSPDTGTLLQLVTRDATAPEVPRVRDRAPADHRSLGRTPVFRPGAGRQRLQYRPTSGMS